MQNISIEYIYIFICFNSSLLLLRSLIHSVCLCDFIFKNDEGLKKIESKGKEKEKRREIQSFDRV